MRKEVGGKKKERAASQLWEGMLWDAVDESQDDLNISSLCVKSCAVTQLLVLVISQHMKDQFLLSMETIWSWLKSSARRSPGWAQIPHVAGGALVVTHRAVLCAHCCQTLIGKCISNLPPSP